MNRARNTTQRLMIMLLKCANRVVAGLEDKRRWVAAMGIEQLLSVVMG